MIDIFGFMRISIFLQKDSHSARGKEEKKSPGHYCKICGERKANERFSGKGHAVHICKECQSLSAEVQTDMRRIRDVERVLGKYPLSR